MVRDTSEPQVGNLFPDGGFENSPDDSLVAGGSGWTLVRDARSGLLALQLGGDAFHAHTRSAVVGEKYQFSGFYRTSRESGVREAGLVFRGREGISLGEQVLTLRPETNYTAFLFTGLEPAGTVSVSAWLYNGANGELIVDDLVLEEFLGAAKNLQPRSDGAPVPLVFSEI